jgi:hypothetical protein
LSADITASNTATEAGTPINKSTLLPDETAEAFGLDPATAVPNDVIIALLAALSPAAIFLASHQPGSIYETTRADENTVAKMQAKYAGSTWELWTDFVRGAASGATLSSGGSNDLIVPYHKHNFTGTSGTTSSNGAAHTHPITVGTMKNYVATTNSAATPYAMAQGTYAYAIGHPQGTYGAQAFPTVTGAASATAHTHTLTPSGTISDAGTAGNTIGANVPAYRDVYRYLRLT